MDKELLSTELQQALDSFGYTVSNRSEDGLALIGKKGIRLNEWWSVIGVYASPSKEGFQVYIKVEVTQDITGGWGENRARQFGLHFCRESQLCKNA